MKKKRFEERAYQKLEVNTSVLEAYRMLRTNIEFSSSVKKIKKILITSSVTGEGKSTISVNLAKVFALNGQKVLVIDMDLRRPSIHSIMQDNNSDGITACLLDRMNPDEAVRTTDTENMYYINCGDIPMNPTELLASDKLKNIVAALEDTYDLLIFDSPPCSTLADAAILSRLADAIILVVSAGNVKYFEVEQAKSNLEKTGVPILGIVMNNVTYNSHSYKYDYYY